MLDMIPLSSRKTQTALPVDALRELEAEGKIGEAHGEYLSTTGVAMSLENSISVGKRMAQYILHKGIDAAILTST